VFKAGFINTDNTPITNLHYTLGSRC